MTHQGRKKLRFDISIWMAISAFAVLAVISAVMALTHFQKQKEQVVELLVEKGATLISSFEAGLRSAQDKNGDIFRIQKLLMETAQQPDIDYIVITDNKGNIIADSDPSMLGRQYGLDLDTAAIASSKDKKWREAANPEGAGTFEVYRGLFLQAEPNGGKVREQINGAMVIYVGFNMSKIEKANAEDTRNTIIIALILLLIGSSAIISLFLAQAYRIARTSLYRVTAFSDALVKNMPIGLIALDEQDKIVTCNETAALILSIDCNYAAGKQAISILPDPLPEIFTELTLRKKPVEKDLQILAGEDKSKTLEIVAASLADNEIPTGKIMLLRDVTTFRQMEKEVARSRHLTSLASLAAGVAHEIRNPLSSIKGFAVYFRELFPENNEERSIADTMIAEVERLNRVISQLIEFARPLTLKREKTSFIDLIRHTLNLLAADIKKNRINVTIDAAPDPPQAEVDSDKVKQVLLNIFLNSLAAMKEGGDLTVKLTVLQDKIILIISDTGTGIEKKDLPRIYDPYFTSKPAGTGLGLAVVQKIMEAHGGTINVESTAGRGTDVRLQFPLTETDKKDL